MGLLGVYHGINPAMGWLFAVALGLQQRSRRAVLSALLPIALGHEASVALAVLLVSGAQLMAAPQALRLLGAAALVGFGLYKLARPRSHPRWVGMRVGARDLVLWSFLMSTAHGAGLMLLPVVLRFAGTAPAAHLHDGGQPHLHLPGQPGVAGSPLTGALLVQDLAAVVVHTLAMLVAMGLVAVVVYEKLGVAVLRRAWVNFDVIWAVVVIVAGVITLFT